MQSISQDPTDPAFVQDPAAFYARARALGDLVYWTDRKTPAAVSHEAVNTLLRDRRFGRAPLEPRALRPGLESFDRLDRLSLLELEPPEHTELRRLIAMAFTGRRISALEPVIRDIAEDLAEGLFASGPEVDLLNHFARPLPLAVICHLMGLDQTHGDEMIVWSNRMVRMYQAHRTAEDETAAEAATQAFEAYLLEEMAAKAKAPDDKLLSALVDAGLTQDQTVATAILLLNAGHEATVHMIGNATFRLINEGVLAPQPSDVAECLRLDPPLHLFSRTAYEEVTLFGHTFQRGDTVDLLLASANRDEVAYPEPDRYDPLRAGPTTVDFGAGLHFCIGAPLARLELNAGLSVLFERHPTLELCAPPARADTWHFHGLEAVRVKAGR